MANDEGFKINVSVGGSKSSAGPDPVSPTAGSEIKPSSNASDLSESSPATAEVPNNFVISNPSFGENSESIVSTDTKSVEQVPASSPVLSETIPNASEQPSNLGYSEANVPVSPAPAPAIESIEKSTEPSSQVVSEPESVESPSLVTLSTPPKKSNFSKKKLVLAVLAVLFIFGGGSVAAYVGLVVPNTPENVWSKSLSNTAAGYAKLVEYQEANKDKTTTKVNGTYNINASDTPIDGSYSFEGDQKTSKSQMNVGILGTRVKAEVLTEITEASQYPDVYMRAEGIKPFDGIISEASPEYAGILASADGQWYSIDHSLFDQILGSQAPDGVELDFNQEDLNSMLTVVGNTTKKYVLTDDESLSVLDASEFVAKETVDNRELYHYKVGLNKDNLKKYVAELKDEVSKTEFYKTLQPEGSELVDLEEVNKSIDKIESSSKADVWVDSSTKLIRSIRFSDKEDANNYLEIGLKYNGGTEFPFYIKVIDKGSGAIDLTATLNTDNNTVLFDAKIKTGSDYSAVSVETKGDFSFTNEAVTIEKPTDTKSIFELFGINPEDAATGLLGAFTDTPNPEPDYYGMDNMQYEL